MPAGDYTLRVILIVPVGAKLTAVTNWLAANVDAATDPAKWPALSASGIAPATHRWWNSAVTDGEARALLFRCCDLAGVPKPTLGQWNGWTKQQKRQWLISVRNALWTGWGIGVSLAVQDSTWDDPDAALALAGLRRVETVPG